MRRGKKTILVRHRDITPPGSQRVNSMKETSHICAESSQKSVRGIKCPQTQRRPSFNAERVRLPGEAWDTYSRRTIHTRGGFKPHV